MYKSKEQTLLQFLLHPVRSIGIPLLALVLTIGFALGMKESVFGVDHKFQHAIVYYLTTLLFTGIIWLGCEAIIIYLDKKLPWQNNGLLRFLAQTFGIIILTYIINTYLCKGINMAAGKEVIGKMGVRASLLVTWITTVIMNLFFAGNYFFKQWKISLLEAEVLKKEQLRTQYELLKTQVNPHFLFNALNTLNALIEEDPKRALKFVNHMADVYRYVLSARESDTVDLAVELECLKSFVFLNEMRFGDNLKVEYQIPDELSQKQLIPMGLQMLVENAIKHNEISKKSPLTIHVIANEKGVTVENKIARKTGVAGTGTGLVNLHKRHESVAQGTLPEIVDTGEVFKVFVPFVNG